MQAFLGAGIVQWREDSLLTNVACRFNSRTWCHMWVEFVTVSRPCFKGFSPSSPVFLPPQKPTLPNSNLVGNLRTTGLSVTQGSHSLEKSLNFRVSP